MRKISIKAAKALKGGYNFKGNNTTVIGGNMFLFNNLIATYHNGKLEIKDAGWQTATTQERLNTILKEFGTPYCIRQKKGVWVLTIKGGLCVAERVWKNGWNQIEN